MDLNATLIAEMFWFLLLVVFTMKVVWPPLVKNLQARQQKIADGLAAAEKGQRELELAEHKKQQTLEAAKQKAAEVIEQAQQRTRIMLEEAKNAAQQEGKRLLQAAQDEIARSAKKARDELQQEVASLALSVAEKLLQQHLDPAANQQLIDKFIKQLGSQAHGGATHE